jgi:hypothetical protein
MTARSHSRTYRKMKKKLALKKRDQGVPRRDRVDQPDYWKRPKYSIHNPRPAA